MITYRLDLDRELTSEEVDANFDHFRPLLRTYIEEKAPSTTYTPAMTTKDNIFKYIIYGATDILAPAALPLGAQGLFILEQDGATREQVTFDDVIYVWAVDTGIADLSLEQMSLVKYNIISSEIIMLRLVYSGDII